ncbi:DUF4175 family protein [Zunongwangia sp. HGR-M22]|uniref:DUF4175 family protein n=1 Tax=Zunongwangia sp. HGR-M22 TaxID=3015168 RepID=UPI0022DE0782|nr:DUF4175 family protein [Zunongwangia sp. HGR-M22]WBL25673.1 hypothetical protein PBT91_17490 [Zunongwangia sp. HGR-M22]
MAEFEAIKIQLRAFIKKYQLNLLIKGSALFLFIGIFYLLILLVFENFLWFDSSVRFALFISVIVVEISLLIVFIGFPLIKYLNLNRAISDKEAAKMIGNYFPEIDDKLLNLIELKSQNNSVFLDAAIRQKSSDLKFYNFSKAVSLTKYRNYVLIACIPILLIIALIISGRGEWMFNSLNRINNYNKVYEKPAPFSFMLNNELKIIEGEDFLLEVNTVGKEIPHQLKIELGDAQYFMKQVKPGRFTYLFKNITENQEFRLFADNISSRTYNLEVISVPKLINFSVNLEFPNYLNRQTDSVKGDGNLTIPEGTVVNWKFQHKNTKAVNFQTSDSTYNVDSFFQKKVLEDLNYTISTSNKNIKNYEPLSFQLNVVKDKLPKIEVDEKIDSLKTDAKFYGGRISDDYGLSKLVLRYRKIGDDKFLSKSIDFDGKTISQFYASFPGEIRIEEGENYEYFFQVFDNDEVNGAKSASTEYFTFYNKTSEEFLDKNLKDQEKSIDNLSEEFEKFKQEDDLEKLLNDQLENKEFDYEQRQKLESFIKNQERENALMEKFSEDIKEKLSNTEKDNSESKDLKKRLESGQEKLEDNRKLLDELKEYSDKISNENLQKKLEELSKNKKSSKRSLEQLVELTKQFYVEQKFNQLASKLDRLGEEQKNLDSLGKSQDEINSEFDQLRKELNDLDQKNKELKRPKSLERDLKSEDEIKDDLEKLKKDADWDSNKSYSQEQNKAGEKMKKLAAEMKQSSASMEMQILKADIESLRKVLDNLVIFSFEQEKLMENFGAIDSKSPEFSNRLKEQYQLKENFEHVDDSLFSLALKNQFIAEKVFEFLEDVSFNLDHSLEELAEVRLAKALSSQQYTITGANDLAVLLNEILDNMNDQMSAGSKSGDSPSGEQLQDIIQQQKQLGEEMEEQMKGQRSEPEGKEENQAELFEIYKRQEEIKRNLEEILKQNGMNMDDLNSDFEGLENDILEDNINDNSLDALDQLNQKMLDLNNSLNEKGEREERESKTNSLQFEDESNSKELDAKEYFNSIEILDRQILPLRQNLKNRVNTYFNE